MENRISDYDLLIQKNNQMNKELDRLNLTLSKYQKQDHNLSILINELETIKDDWIKIVKDLNNQHNEYADLIIDYLNQFKKMNLKEYAYVPNQT